ncbi:MAG: insulinase family protein [Lachnospiraceae bacterium]
MTRDLKSQVLQFFHIEEERDSLDLHAKVFRITHKKTGAKIAAIINDDKNKVFYIGFRTPPTDDTGVPHILEHSVLCGSKSFPLKDPFIELAKGSLNTFLNAMTYPDRTLYPIASCNDKDFQNLMHVYLDAVFYPNIYSVENIFRQEGWHYELESLDADLLINGVVYNEMKGAFSSADDVLEREIMNSLYPDTSYGVESGGTPSAIPDLSYEQFLEFHKTLYHPSNSYLYLYGDLDLWEKLMFIHESYLKEFDYLSMDTAVTMQKPFLQAKEIRKPYPILQEEETDNKTYLSYNISIGTSLDMKQCVALQILDYALCSAPGAPLKQALVDLGIGTEVYSLCEDGILQPYFSIVAKDANESQKELFVKTIEEVLTNIVSDGITKKTLQAAIHSFEFKYKEADYGRYPKGLMYGLQLMDGWNYDDSATFLHIELGAIYQELREQSKQGYFEELVQTLMLDNTHKSILVMYPQRGMTEKVDEELKEKLAKIKASMSSQELRDIMRMNQELEEYQDAPSTPQELASIPLLTRDDLDKQAITFCNFAHEVDGVTVLSHPLETNGIVYLRLIFDTQDVTQELFPYLSLLKTAVGLMDTKHHKYNDLFDDIHLVTGGIDTVTNIYTRADDFGKAKITFELKTKVLYENMNQAIDLMEEMMYETIFADKKRLQEIISESKSRMQGQMISAGHSVATHRAMSYLGKIAATSEVLSGLSYYQLLDELDKNFDKKHDEIIDILQTLTYMIFRKENLFVDITAQNNAVETLIERVPSISSKLYTVPVQKGSYEPKLEKKNEGFKTSGQVQYVCRAGNYFEKGLSYTGALKVLKSIMGYEYLWNQVRVKGGAYGCMCSFGKTGESYFVSYRDPNLEKTVEVYEQAAQAIADFEADERTMTQYVIGAISELDTPMNPAAYGLFSLGGYFTGQSEEAMQMEREQVLTCDVEAIKALSGHIRAFMEDEALCVVGSAQKIEEAKEQFLNIKQLL